MLTLTVVSQSSTKITLGWTPVAGCSGYAFFADGVRKSNTWDPTARQVTFAKGASVYRVDALGVSMSGSYPPVAPPPPPPPPPPAGAVAFGSRPSMAAKRFYYVGDVVLDNQTITGMIAGSDEYGPGSGRGLVIAGSHNTVITNCDFVGPNTGIYMDDCSGTLTIRNCRFSDVGWNALQMNHSVITGGRVSDIKVKGGSNEDMFSFVGGGSGGISAADPLIYERIYVEGDPSRCRPSGSGFMFEGAQHVIFRNFTMLNPGQIGFGIHPGTNIRVTDGIVYSQAYKAAAMGDTGADLGDPAITPASLTEVARIQSKWYAKSGSENPVYAPQAANIIGWASNNWSAPVDPAAIAVVL